MFVVKEMAGAVMHDFVYQKQKKKAIIPCRKSQDLQVCDDNEDG